MKSIEEGLYLVKHTTVRFAWHDDKWDGGICKDPHFDDMLPMLRMAYADTPSARVLHDFVDQKQV